MEMNNVQSLFEPFLLLYGIVTLPLGIILLLWGYKVFKFYIAFTGFFVGFLIGTILSGILGESSIATGILVGLICSALFYIFYLVGIFMIGFSLGALLGILLGISTGDPGLFLFMVITLGIIGGIIALSIKKAIIIISTSFAGASLIVGGFQALFFNRIHIFEMNNILLTQSSITTYYINIILISLLTAIIGILYQYDIIKKNINSVLPNKVLELANENSVSKDVDFKNDKSKSVDSKETDNLKENDTINRREFTISNQKNKIKLPEISLAKVALNKYVTLVSDKIIDGITNIIDSVKDIFNHKTEESIEYENAYLPFMLKQLNGLNSGNIYDVIGSWNGEYYSTTIGCDDYSAINHISVNEKNYSLNSIHAELIYFKNKIYIRSIANSYVTKGNSPIGSSSFEKVKYGDIISLRDLSVKVIKR